MRKEINPMPKCFDPACVDGIITERVSGELVRRVCKKCEKMEKDLLESPDYDVYIVNGKVVGYELIIN